MTAFLCILWFYDITAQFSMFICTSNETQNSANNSNATAVKSISENELNPKLPPCATHLLYLFVAFSAVRVYTTAAFFLQANKITKRKKRNSHTYTHFRSYTGLTDACECSMQNVVYMELEVRGMIKRGIVVWTNWNTFMGLQSRSLFLFLPYCVEFLLQAVSISTVC